MTEIDQLRAALVAAQKLEKKLRQLANRGDCAAADLGRGCASLIEASLSSDADDLYAQLVLADWLSDRGDPREQWVRTACALWVQCGTIVPAGAPWNYEVAKTAIGKVTGTAAGWRMSCLFGCLVAWHSPKGDGSGPMGRSWPDARIGAAWRGVWWWALGFAVQSPITDQRPADAAGSQEIVWQFARIVWDLCLEKLPALELS